MARRRAASGVNRLSEVLGEVADYHEAEAQERGLTLAVSGEAAADRPPAVAAGGVHLVSNAVRYADAGSTIRIHVSHDDEHALIAVSNAGEPIAKEHLPRLFHRFYRGDEARGFDANHHGLGLAIVGHRPHARRPALRGFRGPRHHHRLLPVGAQDYRKLILASGFCRDRFPDFSPCARCAPDEGDSATGIPAVPRGGLSPSWRNHETFHCCVVLHAGLVLSTSALAQGPAGGNPSLCRAALLPLAWRPPRSDASAPLTRAQVLADLAVWKKSGMSDLYRGNQEPDVYSAKYRKRCGVPAPAQRPRVPGRAAPRAGAGQLSAPARGPPVLLGIGRCCTG